jgi:hypothetical protein
MRAYNKEHAMRTIYKIKSEECGTVRLKKRKIAKALRWWLREKGITYQYIYFSD